MQDSQGDLPVLDVGPGALARRLLVAGEVDQIVHDLEGQTDLATEGTHSRTVELGPVRVTKAELAGRAVERTRLRGGDALVHVELALALIWPHGANARARSKARRTCYHDFAPETRARILAQAKRLDDAW